MQTQQKRHVCHWSPEWRHPGPLFRSSKIDPALDAALVFMTREEAAAHVQQWSIDPSVLPPAGRTLRARNFSLNPWVGF